MTHTILHLTENNISQHHTHIYFWFDVCVLHLHCAAFASCGVVLWKGWRTEVDQLFSAHMSKHTIEFLRTSLPPPPPHTDNKSAHQRNYDFLNWHIFFLYNNEMDFYCSTFI